MDEKYLQFLSDFFAVAAQGKQTLKDISGWMEKGFAGSEELTRMVKEFYGLEDTDQGAAGWQKATADFKASFDEYLGMMGVVPQDTYLELVEKYERLKKTAADQEETIRHLEMLLKQKGKDQGDLTRDFARLMSDQADQFKAVMDTWTRLLKKND